MLSQAQKTHFELMVNVSPYVYYTQYNISSDN